MSEYIFLYRGGDLPATPEKMQQQMQRWMTWLKKLGEQGHLKDSGHPLDRRAGKVVHGPQKTATDGPYAEKDLVGGYSLVEARDLGHAVELSNGCPIFEVGGLVEVRPILKM